MDIHQRAPCIREILAEVVWLPWLNHIHEMDGDRIAAFAVLRQVLACPNIHSAIDLAGIHTDDFAVEPPR